MVYNLEPAQLLTKFCGQVFLSYSDIIHNYLDRHKFAGWRFYEENKKVTSDSFC